MTNYLLLIILPLLLGLLAQWRVKSVFGKYSVVRTSHSREPSVAFAHKVGHAMHGRRD